MSQNIQDEPVLSKRAKEDIQAAKITLLTRISERERCLKKIIPVIYSLLKYARFYTQERFSEHPKFNWQKVLKDGEWFIFLTSNRYILHEAVQFTTDAINNLGGTVASCTFNEYGGFYSIVWEFSHITVRIQVSPDSSLCELEKESHLSITYKPVCR